MNRVEILLVGAGGHARACIDVIERGASFAVRGLVGAKQEVGATVLGYRVLGTDADLPSLLRDNPYALVAVGQVKTPDPRIRLFALLAEHGAICPVVVSPRAYVSRHAFVAEGTIVMHDAVVNAGARIGRNCILNSQALVEHDATIGDHCHVATSATLNSEVRLGEGSFVGSKTSVRQGIRIGARCVIGLGQRVVRDCEDGTWLPIGVTRS